MRATLRLSFCVLLGVFFLVVSGRVGVVLFGVVRRVLNRVFKFGHSRVPPFVIGVVLCMIHVRSSSYSNVGFVSYRFGLVYVGSYRVKVYGLPYTAIERCMVVTVMVVVVVVIDVA